MKSTAEFKIALDLAYKIPKFDPYRLFVLLNNTGLSYLAEKKHQQANENLMKGLIKLQNIHKTDTHPSMVDICYWLGRTNFHLVSYDSAMEFYDRSQYILQ